MTVVRAGSEFTQHVHMTQMNYNDILDMLP